MELMFYFLLIISITTMVIYVLMIFNYYKKWNQIVPFNLPDNLSAFQTSVSIIVAVRNEESNILKLLQCLVQQSYPKALTEIIIVDDHSEDKTAELVNKFIPEHGSSLIQLIQLKESKPELKNKKAAIEHGIKNSTGTLIITTDGDCIMGNHWLSTLVAYYETKHPAMIVAPVFLSGNGFFQKLQQVEFISLMAVTASSVENKKPLMCNGANLAYSRKIFLEVGGFDNNQNVASGDDTFLMFKIAKLNPGNIHFLKSLSATVYTAALTDLFSFLQQRVRWASKTGSYKIAYVSQIGYLVSIYNLLLPALLIISIFDSMLLLPAGLLFIIKFITDAIYVNQAAIFFKQKQPYYFLFFFIAAVCYPIYFLIVALRSYKASYYWKGRSHDSQR